MAKRTAPVKAKGPERKSVSIEKATSGGYIVSQYITTRYTDCQYIYRPEFDSGE